MICLVKNLVIGKSWIMICLVICLVTMIGLVNHPMNSLVALIAPLGFPLPGEELRMYAVQV